MGPSGHRRRDRPEGDLVSVHRPARLVGLVTGMALAAALLGGCGAAQPGVAANVGDETITVDQVDDLAADVCTLQAALPQGGAQQPQTTTGLAARDGALQSMVLRSMAEQMAADFGFTADEEYQR